MNRLKRTRTKFLFAAILFIILPLNSPQAQGPPDREFADLILTNGVIWTVDSRNSVAEAVAISNGKFVVVGSDQTALKLRGPKTQVIDLKGSFVVPGFNDNHVHFASAAQFLEFNIMNVSNQEDFVARVKEVIGRLPEGEWIVGGFWGAYAFKSIQGSGAILSFGTDWPGTSASDYPINPMLGLYAAVTRQTISGQPQGGWFPAERITIQDAIKAYTYNTAYANFEEKTKGSIEVGKLADLTVLSKNLLKVTPMEFLKTKVVYTIVNGRVVYQSRL